MATYVFFQGPTIHSHLGDLFSVKVGALWVADDVHTDSCPRHLRLSTLHCHQRRPPGRSGSPRRPRPPSCSPAASQGPADCAPHPTLRRNNWWQCRGPGNRRPCIYGNGKTRWPARSFSISCPITTAPSSPLSPSRRCRPGRPLRPPQRRELGSPGLRLRRPFFCSPSAVWKRPSPGLVRAPPESQGRVR